MLLRRALLLLCAIVSIVENLTAQQAFFQEETFSPLSSKIKHVTGIAADKNNCIWFSTQTGIYRYDGARFKHYSVLNTSFLKFERMADLVLRMKGKEYSWCLLDTKGNLYEVDSLSTLGPLSAGTSEDEIITYQKYGYYVLGRQKGQVPPSIPADVFEVHVIPDSKSVFTLRENGVVSGASFKEFFGGKQGAEIYTIDMGAFTHQKSTKIITTTRFFYAVTPKELLRWKNHSAQPLPVELSGHILANNTRKIKYEKLYTLKSANPAIILLWYEGNIYEAFESGETNTLETKLLIEGKDLEIPVSVLYSPKQHLFISYFINKGIVFYRPVQFSLLKTNNQGPSTNLTDYYYSVIPDKDGFITANDAGLVWLGNAGGKRILNGEPCFKYFLFKDKAGNIWHEEKNKQYVSYLEAGTGKIVRALRSLPQNILIGVHQADDSTYYMLTNRILRKIILKKREVTSSTTIYTAPPGIEYNVLYSLNSQTLWLGSDRGLMEFNISSGIVKKINDLGDIYVRSVIKLKENNYLVGTYDKGIYQYINGEWKQLSSQERDLPSSAHAFIIDEATSSVWVSSNEGIICLSLNQLLNESNQARIASRRFTNFGPDISAEFNGSSNVSGAKLSDTCIAFANANGLVMFDPMKLVSHPLPSNILIEPTDDNSADLLFANKISTRHIAFNPVVPYFGDPNDLQVLYFLTNSDNEWHTWSPNSTISYNNLKPGEHDLQFRISHHNDAPEKGVFLTAKSFSVAYRWYEKPWFYVAIGLAGMMLLVMLHYLRIWHILRKRKELEKLVKSKTAELHEANDMLVNVIDELSASEAHLKQINFLKDEYYAVLTHDIRSPLKFLSFNIGKLLETSPRSDSETLKNGLYAAYQCSADVYKLVDEFVYWIQDNENQLKPQPEPTVIASIINDAKKVYDLGLDSQRNQIEVNVPDHLKFNTDPKLLFIILRNALDNANKYTTNGTVSISAMEQSGSLKISIADTGRGMTDELVKALTGLQYLEEQPGFKKRKSLGFYIMAMLTKKLGGKYSLTSEKEKGTTLEFILPELKEI